MSLTHLLFRNLVYHWRGNLAVGLGVAVGAAVLAGALLVGDSLRGSLRDRAERQLNGFDFALIGPHFIHQDVAGALPAREVQPVILLRGGARADPTPPLGEAPARPGLFAGRVTVVGVATREKQSGWERVLAPPPHAPPGAEPVPTPLEFNGCYVSAQLARDLDLRPGDRVTVTVQKASAVPRESLLGRPGVEEVEGELPLTVQAVLPDDHPYSRFSPTPSPAAPRNLFVGLPALQGKLDQPGRVNALFVRGGDRPALQTALARHLRLEDWGLTVRDPETRTRDLFDRLARKRQRSLTRSNWGDFLAVKVAEAMDADHEGTLTREEVAAYYRSRGDFTLESRQLLLEPYAAEAALAAAKEANLTAAPTLAYLANRIRAGDKDIPYSVVAALDPSLPPPLGLGLSPPLADDEILLSKWAADRLPARSGEPVSLVYFAPEQKSGPPQPPARFKLRAVVPQEGIAADPDLTPEFPGLTDQTSLTDWDPPPPFDRDDIRQSVQKPDKDYWRDYRTAPKAFVTLAAGQKLWGSRFGNLTSVRLAPPAGTDLMRAAVDFRRRVLAGLDPERGGFTFEDLRERVHQASQGGQDFGMLFLAFSVFLIAAALLLVGLLFRLNLERRAGEIGLLLAAGYRVRTVRWLLVAEGAFVALIGAAVGLLGAVGYAALLLDLLVRMWPTGLPGSFLRLHLTAAGVLTGYVASVAVGVLTIVAAVRVLRRVSPSALLAGETTPADAARPARWAKWVAVGSAVGALGCGVGGLFVRDAEARAGTFFGSGALLLTAALAAVWLWMRSSRHTPVTGTGPAALIRLGARNAARNPLRSLLTAALLASAAFLLVAVESFRRQPEADFLDKNSGSGGFALLVETDLPLYQLPNREGWGDFADALARLYQRDQATKDQRLAEAKALLDRVTFEPFRLKEGDDASCLNLYQPGRPRLLGAPASLIDRGGFRFAGTEAQTPEEKANPWLLLRADRWEGAVPVFGEENTVVWILKKGLGGALTVPDEQGRQVRLRIVGLLKDSVFQSGLMMSADNFQRLYPHAEGFPLLLAATPPGEEERVADLLRTGLAGHGVEVTPTADRLREYLAVENTYLSTFQLLGGFGLLLGALGLAVVLLRGVWERRGELALLRALGYRYRALGGLVLAENAALLALGLAAGVGAALIAVAPHLVSGEGELPWLRLALLLGLVLLVGLAAGAAAVAATLRAPLVPALRRE
jgi:ABC-type antimicrobial peptide transport system permease subunit